MSDDAYTISLQDIGWTDTFWEWRLYDAEAQVATGTANTRWGATRKAKRAARRHAAGLPTERPKRPNTFSYNPPVRSS